MSLFSQARLRLASVFLVASVASLGAIGCGDYSIYNKPINDPWDPGPRKRALATTARARGMPPMPPMCEVSERRCDFEFIYKGMGRMAPPATEKSVELRGDYKAGGWMTGDAMAFDGKVWRVKASVPWVTKL